MLKTSKNMETIGLVLIVAAIVIAMIRRKNTIVVRKMIPQ